MLKFKFEESFEFANYYALKLNDETAATLLDQGRVENQEQAIHLSRFFWNMVEASIEDTNNQTKSPWSESAEFLTEKIMYAISGYLETIGFENEWESVADERGM